MNRSAHRTNAPNESPNLSGGQAAAPQEADHLAIRFRSDNGRSCHRALASVTAGVGSASAANGPYTFYNGDPGSSKSSTSPVTSPTGASSCKCGTPTARPLRSGTSFPPAKHTFTTPTENNFTLVGVKLINTGNKLCMEAFGANPSLFPEPHACSSERKPRDNRRCRPSIGADLTRCADSNPHYQAWASLSSLQGTSQKVCANFKNRYTSANVVTSPIETRAAPVVLPPTTWRNSS